MDQRVSAQPIEFVQFEGAEGNSLAADLHGPGNSRPVLLAHGGGQTRHAWGGTAQRLADRVDGPPLQSTSAGMATANG